MLYIVQCSDGFLDVYKTENVLIFSENKAAVLDYKEAERVSKLLIELDIKFNIIRINDK